MKYAFVRNHCEVWPIGIQCGVLKVSVSGYHEHFVRRLRIAERRHLSDEAQVWVGDITYIATEEGWLYFAVVVDLFSRRIVGCHFVRKYAPRL